MTSIVSRIRIMLTHLLHDLQFPKLVPARVDTYYILYGDNKIACHIAANSPGKHQTHQIGLPNC